MTAGRSAWLEQLPRVRLELDPEAVFTRVYVNDEEWRASVKRVSIDVEEGATVVTMAFHAKVTAEGPLDLTPWPIEVVNRRHAVDGRTGPEIVESNERITASPRTDIGAATEGEPNA